MTVLYIVGNGFDLWHKLPTSYNHFYLHAKSRIDSVERYFAPSDIDKPWSDFENLLGTYDWSEIFDEYNYSDPTSDDFKISETYGLHDELVERTDDLHYTISECFIDWANQIDVSDAPTQMKFISESRFLTFNYTPTLQSVYGVEESRVFHIHGKADSGNIVFGHGVEIIDEAEFDENGESKRTIYTDAENAAKYPLHAFKKQTEKNIKDNKYYFDSIVGLKKIKVIGHSLSDVDLPYVEEIARRNVESKWVVYCYKESEKEVFVKQLNKCGIKNEMIMVCQYPSA